MDTDSTLSPSSMQTPSRSREPPASCKPALRGVSPPYRASSSERTGVQGHCFGKPSPEGAPAPPVTVELVMAPILKPGESEARLILVQPLGFQFLVQVLDKWGVLLQLLNQRSSSPSGISVPSGPVTLPLPLTSSKWAPL